MDIKGLGRRAAAAGAAVVTAGAALTLITPATANAALSWGAIAYSSNGAGAVVWNYPSRDAASQAAVTYCGWTSCEPMTAFPDCGVAVRNDQYVQTARGATLGAATRAALDGLPGGGGYIDLWACN